MKSLVAALLVAASLFAFSYQASADVRYPQHVEESLVRLTYVDSNGLQHGCTGFVISRRDKIAATANHCIPHANEQLLADGLYTFVLVQDAANDLAIIQLFGIDKPALRPRSTKQFIFFPKRLIEANDEVWAVGFGFALKSPTVKWGNVLNPLLAPEEDMPPGVVTNFPFVGGQSGGPLTDENGDVVGMIQRSNSALGYAATLENIMKLAGRFWHD